jgi:hypothetical protein
MPGWVELEKKYSWELNFLEVWLTRVAKRPSTPCGLPRLRVSVVRFCQPRSAGKRSEYNWGATETGRTTEPAWILMLDLRRALWSPQSRMKWQEYPPGFLRR